MRSEVLAVLARLDRFWDRIVRRPLADEEIDRLDSAIGSPIPGYLRAYLGVVGLFQDLPTEDVLVFESATEFVNARESLVTWLGTGASDYLPFGHDGAGNYFVVHGGNDSDNHVYFADHETASIQPAGRRVIDWLVAVVDTTLATMDTRAPNSAKSWKVQFTFELDAPDPILAILREVGVVRLPTGAWEPGPTSPAGVRTATLRFELDDQPHTMQRLEHPSWRSPSYSFKMQEPVDTPPEDSQIRRMDERFRASVPGYRLVDYGPLLNDITGS
jgi:hypothetical protein